MHTHFITTSTQFQMFSKLLAKRASTAIFKIMKSAQDDTLNYDAKTIMKLRNLIAFYVDTNEDTTHPARKSFLRIEKLLDNL